MNPLFYLAPAMDARVIIDNCIVSKTHNGVRVTPIRLAKKRPELLNIDVDGLKKITFGSKLADNGVLSKLATGEMNYEDLFQQ